MGQGMQKDGNIKADPCVITWTVTPGSQCSDNTTFWVLILVFSKGHLFTVSQGPDIAQLANGFHLLTLSTWLWLSKEVGIHNQLATQGGI